MTWVDVAFLAVVVLSLVAGLVKGLVRQVIGLAAAVLGFVLAAVYYRDLTPAVLRLVHNLFAAQFTSFLLIFVAVLLAGWAVGHLVSKLLKGPFAVVNHLLGGAFGLLKGVLVCGVLTLAMVAFGVARTTLQRSVSAPAAFAVAGGIVRVIPRNLGDRFRDAVRDIRKGGRGNGQEI